MARTAEVPAGRVVQTFSAIVCEYSPEREELARLLAQRVAIQNEKARVEIAATTRDSDATLRPLSPEELLANRTAYLARVAALLHLKQPTPLQEECYDAFLDSYELFARTKVKLEERWASLQVIKRVTVWDRSELVKRLENDEKIHGFFYDPVAKAGRANFGSSLHADDDELRELAAKRAKLHRDYSLSFESKGGTTTYRGRVSPRNRAETIDAVGIATSMTEALPVVIPAELSTLPAEELAARLWSGTGDRSLERFFDILRRAKPRGQDNTLAFVVLHEAIEVGIVDAYFRGRDRRWFCDGVANYGAWRIIRDLHGDAIANKVHDLRVELTKYADLREQADLRKWQAVERQAETDQHSRLDDARYAFAERAVALMNERAGDDCLPRLFAEIGKTAPAKVSMKTVERAWKKISGTELDAILAAAVQPLAVGDAQ